MTKATLLVTGSSGHAGQAICRAAKGKYHVVGVDRVEGPFTTKVGDLTNSDWIREATNGVDVVIHTASLHAPHVTSFSKEKFIDVNLKGTLYLLESCVKNKVQKFIYTSTTSLYGEQFMNANQAVWVTEDLTPIPRDIYDITKISAEHLCKDFFDKKTLQTVVLRTSRFWNEPEEKRVFYRMYRGVDVRDVVQAHLLAIEHRFNQFEIFNISAETIFTQEDLVDLRMNCQTVLNKRLPEITQFYAEKNWEMPSSIDRVYVIEKAKALLGYQPNYNIAYLLNKTD